MAQDSGISPAPAYQVHELDTYTPPAMFDDDIDSPNDTETPKAAKKKKTSKPSYSIQTLDVLESETITDTVQVPNNKTPVAERLPTIENGAAPALTTATITQQPRYDDLPPLPKRRPTKFFASPAYIEEMRRAAVLAAQRQKRIENSQIDPALIQSEPTIDMQSDPLGRDVPQLEARDILSNIDPAAELPPKRRTTPKAAENKTRRVTKDISQLPKLPSQIISQDNVVLTIPYQLKDTLLPRSKRDLMQDRVILPLTKSIARQVYVIAYASIPRGDISTAAKRIALDRAIEVREHIKSFNIDDSRIHIRAMPHGADIAPFDRVDFILE